MLGIPVSKEFGFNAISFWVSALIDFCQKNWGKGVKLDEEMLMYSTV